MMRFGATRTRKFVVRYAASRYMDGVNRGKEGDEGTGGERERERRGGEVGGGGCGRKNRWRTRDQTGELGSGTGVARHARTAEGAAGTRVVNPLGEGESEFAALNMVDSRIGCAVAGRCGPHHRPAGRTIPVAVYEPSRGVFIPSRGGGSRSGELSLVSAGVTLKASSREMRTFASLARGGGREQEHVEEFAPELGEFVLEFL